MLINKSNKKLPAAYSIIKLVQGAKCFYKILLIMLKESRTVFNLTKSIKSKRH